MEDLYLVFVLAESDNGVTGKTDKPVLAFVSCLIWGLKSNHLNDVYQRH